MTSTVLGTDGGAAGGGHPARPEGRPRGRTPHVTFTLTHRGGDAATIQLTLVDEPAETLGAVTVDGDAVEPTEEWPWGLRLLHLPDLSLEPGGTLLVEAAMTAPPG